MLNAIIRFALRQRLLVIAFSLFLIGYGTWQISQMTIDVFPNLNRPRVVVMTEAPGMAPEEVESLITFPMETALNGSNGVVAVRSSSGVGISVIYVEFDWNTDIYNDRQIVAERLQLVQDRLPENIKPQLAPISSIMGQILMVGMWSEGGKTDPMEVRTIADWVVRQRLLSIPGVSQVFTMGGGRKQFQVLVNPDEMLKYGVTLHQVKTAVQESNENATGGYLDEQGANELLVRALGRLQTTDDLKKVVVTIREGRPVTLEQIAEVKEGPQVKRGDSAAFVRNKDGTYSGGPAVVLTINKQPNADTREVTNKIFEAIEELKPSLPDDIRIEPEIYSQKGFIDRAITNVLDALRDGGLLVIIILYLFLMNFRTTFITLTAIPLSIVMTAMVFAAFGMSINTMTLGGIAVAIGELVDDAIVDVENIFRRLRENSHTPNRKPALLVIFQASVEIRNSIVFGTMIVVLVFLPLFALSGMEGRLFTPLGIAYIVSILSSLLVSLTVTPVLSYLLLAQKGVWPWVALLLAGGIATLIGLWVVPLLLSYLSWELSFQSLVWIAVGLTLPLWGLILWADRFGHGESDGLVLRFLKYVGGLAIRLSLQVPILVMLLILAVVLFAGFKLSQLERDFLPPFDEGVAQLNVILPPGTSLATSNKIAGRVEQRVLAIDGVQGIARRTGRAELDEHAEGVNMSECIISFDPDSERSREEILDEIREAMADVPGIVASVEQPMAHLISHMLSGVKAQVAIKLYGDDLNILRRKANEMKAAISGVDGVTDLNVEQQVIIPQLRIEYNRDKLKLYGLTPAYVNDYVHTAMNGKVVSEVLIDQQTFDLLIRMDEKYRENLEALKRLSLDLPKGGTAPLSSVAYIYESAGPNTINREQVRRRIVVQCNVSNRGLVDVVEDIQKKLNPIAQELPAGYFIEYGGQFESQQSATQVIGLLFLVALVGIFLVLYTMFRSVVLAVQEMAALPTAFIGAVAALYLTGQTLTVASMVGFISLCGIASRNGILLINHYIHLVRYEGETWSKAMIVRAGQERLAPVLMTALTSGIGLVPLALSAGEPGKEILYPVATVIIGGLISSTVLEFILRPALFWMFGMKAAERIVSESKREVPLVEEHQMQDAPVPTTNFA